ncbi:MAG TPA: hypothetical protein PKA88_39180 [Polyangiaceae bacterium]|nr:hypothetical protein [Polyangiaceae bacterium]HMR75749.1 hypothetical protein [Polyangiaceae bacterium]
MLVGFLVVLAVVAISIYVSLMMRFVPGFADQRLGKLDPLPERIGEWVSELDPEGKSRAAPGEVREVRYLFDPDAGFLAAGKLTRQVRYRDAKTNAILRTEPDAQVVRKRRRGGSR